MESINPLGFVTAVLALIIAVVGHEIMHGWVAYKYGDYTAKNAGRLSINPLLHIDLVGTIIVPAVMYLLPLLMNGEGGFIFGWAKPVPINMSTVVRNAGYNGAMQVDLAGIVYNFTVAVLASIIILNFTHSVSNDSFMFQLLQISVMLGVFNLLPIPQFDGANFLAHLAIKYKKDFIAEFFYKNERFAMIFVVIIIVTPLSFYLIGLPVYTIMTLLLT